MLFFQNYQKGVNLGGWISQFPSLTASHFDAFITERDLAQIAQWGFDHVRLPVDYPVLESDDHPGQYLETGFGYIDRCLDWCQANNLGVILDLHHAPGYTFTSTLEDLSGNKIALFTQPEMQARLMDLWSFIAARYRGTDLIFELLNEVCLPDSQPWNALAVRLIEAVHAVDPTRKVIIGPNFYNAVSELTNLVYLDDPRVGYTFHFYEPLLFTHQKAAWTPITRQYDRQLDYPGGFPGLAAFLEQHPEHQAAYDRLVGREMNRDLLAEMLSPAVDFMQTHPKPLYCGEFGVIDTAPQPSARRWHADLIDIFKAWGIGYAVWSYKAMNFGLVDAQGTVADPILLDILTQA